MYNKTVKNKKRIGIKWKMFAILLAFLVAVIFVVWLFQVFLLDVFYRNTKFNELELTAEKLISVSSDKEVMKTVVYDCSKEYDSSIIVFEVEDGSASIIHEAGPPTGIISFFSKRDLQTLYENAYYNEGKYIGIVSNAAFFDDLYSKNEKEFIEYKFMPTFRFEFDASEPSSAIDVRCFSNGTDEYIVIQTADLSPLDSTVKTLNAQFVWIGIILALLALALAGIMSKLITKPIIKMNASAQNLAFGKYDTVFEGNGYREIYELSQTLNFAESELAKADKLQKELISNVSHDLRTPLTMIKGYGEVMRDIPGENTAENIQVIIDETERLTSLVNDMLDVSKFQAGTRMPDIQLFSLTQAVNDTMKRYEKLTEQDGYDIQFSFDSDVCVYADSVMILQVVYNLINNAINYTGEDKKVRVKQTVNGNWVRISVTDTGSGISKEDIPLIWDRYYKVDKVHKRATIGTGLGLSITREILELHNSQFGVISTLGVGSTFWFELKIAENRLYER